MVSVPLDPDAAVGVPRVAFTACLADACAIARRCVVVAGFALLGLTATPAEAQMAASSFSGPPEAWRAAYEKELREEYGWLSVAGLVFLAPGEHTVGSAPDSGVVLPAGRTPLRVGTLVVTPESTTLRLAPGVEALVNGEPASAETVLQGLRPAEPGQPSTQADRVRVGRIEFHLHKSGERLGLRVRDPDSPIRLGFEGPKWYPVSDQARVIATFKPFEEPKVVDVPNILGDDEPYQSPGQLEFTWEGRKLRVLAFTATMGRLHVIYRDAGLGRETYGTRYIYADPTGDGRYVLDFNKSYNPPCAYNPHTTCPTPPKQNILKVAIRAGEKLYDGGR